ncbi:hypothetical protein LTR84_001464 [Exophiala bonariae]|uniref:Zn(2)-C6 fungal-type domain-containing protein n=1 Tax=Exophiala bonariae TaxID=1690606 RepID=A0AAV9NG73_9EURO|nr:hypothetical protein LTR84_001464 [Exophiala bonariae]
MSRAPRTKACDACHRAKRKCGKQTPSCLRCTKRGFECRYPATKPSCFVLCEDGFNFNENVFGIRYQDLNRDVDAVPSSCLAVSQSVPTHEAARSPDFDVSQLPSSKASSLVRQHSFSSWLKASDSHDFDSLQQLGITTLRFIDVKCHVVTIRRWLHQWVDTGSNPFIHKLLYMAYFPRCIQDAYLALSCYLRKATSNERLVTQIIEDRATQLIQDHAVVSGKAREGQVGTVPVSSASFAHIARVQALLVYQFIGLYDGDIRMRHLAEGRIPVLYSWAQQMFEHYSRTTYAGSTLDSQIIRDLASFHSVESAIRNSDDFAWYEWITAETIRRTAIIACGMQTLYIVLQQGGTIPCQKDIMYTPNKGLWEAESSMDWEKLCSETNATLVQTADVKQVLTTLGPASLDDFATVLQISSGT